jgi:hypothetical protein
VVNSPYFKERDKSRSTYLVSVVGQYATNDMTRRTDSNSTTGEQHHAVLWLGYRVNHSSIVRRCYGLKV